MTKHLKIFLPLVTALLFLVSCGDLAESSHNGKLDGYWKLAAIDTLATGGQTDLHNQSLFMAVQGTIMMLNNIDNGTGYIFQFNHADGHLKIYDARVNDREGGDPQLTSSDNLKSFGFSELEEDFTVEELTGGKLILNDGTLRLHFIKF